MIRKNMRTLGLVGAVLVASAFPVVAAQPPVQPDLDLSVYDQMPRVGNAQLATDPYCDRPDALAVSLSEDYAEEVVLTAQDMDGKRFDFWASETMGTWTVSYTRADGITCVVGSGTGWTSGDSAGAHMQQIGLRL